MSVRMIPPRPLRSDWLKGVPAGALLSDADSFARKGWRLGDGLVPPVALLLASALDHNARLMAEYSEARGLSLAPHGKTTMAPQLVDLQLARGAWGVTVSTAHQARVYAESGVRRILLAHEVVDINGIREIAALKRRHPELDLVLLADSLEAVSALGRGLSREAAGSVGVLVELGVPNGRTGCRSVDRLIEIARAVSRHDSLRLKGVEGYEGVIDQASQSETLEAVDAYLELLVQAATKLVREDLIQGEAIISAGGSAYFDRVGVGLSALEGFTRLLRSGCYLIHDNGKFSRLSPLDGRSVGDQRLRAALEVWAAVVSVPEPGMAVLNAGRRDIGYDAGMPKGTKLMRSASEDLCVLDPTWEVTRLWDQHAVVRVPGGDSVVPGDLVGLGISHPCTTLDKWKLIPLVDDAYSVVDGIWTFF